MPKFYVTASDREYAEKLTKQIRSAADDLWALLLQAWESKAWASLGYKGWNDYVAKEFDFNRRHSYRLVNQGQVIRQLREAAAVSPDGHTTDQIHVSEAEARVIYPIREQVAADVREQVASGVEPVEAVRVAVERVRAVPISSGGFGHIEDGDEPSTCVHEYVCRHCGELLA